MAYKRYHGERVSADHYTLLTAYEKQFGTPAQVNEGARTIAEQWNFYRIYQRDGWPIAAYPVPSAPHIKFRRRHHALDINAGSQPGQAQHVAAFYRSHGIPVAFNVSGESWHMDTLSSAALHKAAEKLREDNKWRGYTADERRWIAEYDRLKRTKKDKARRRRLRATMKHQRQVIYAEAQKTGWNKNNRRRRYASLLARSR